MVHGVGGGVVHGVGGGVVHGVGGGVCDCVSQKCKTATNSYFQVLRFDQNRVISVWV